jgi:predicted ArsR family transcriptional regulator
VDDVRTQLDSISALAEPARRALYLYVLAQSEPVSRDQAVTGVGLPRHTVKFHLDKLVEEGFLDVEFQRLSGRGGPGAGRPTKLYRRSVREVAITLPARHYDMAAQILAGGIEDATRRGVSVLEAVQCAATEAGHRLGRSHPDAGSAEPTGFGSILSALAANGYRPRADGDRVVLSNCPFHALARDHAALVCGMNLHFIAALLDELGHPEVQAELAPAADRCCVTLTDTACAGR